MSVFQEILEVSRAQSEALARGDLDAAMRMVQDRAVLIEHAGSAATPEDEDAIREVLRRDRDLSSAIRERMIEIRNHSRKLQQGRVALSGYQSQPRQLGLLDTTS